MIQSPPLDIIKACLSTILLSNSHVFALDYYGMVFIWTALFWLARKADRNIHANNGLLATKPYVTPHTESTYRTHGGRGMRNAYKILVGKPEW